MGLGWLLEGRFLGSSVFLYLGVDLLVGLDEVHLIVLEVGFRLLCIVRSVGYRLLIGRIESFSLNHVAELL